MQLNTSQKADDPLLKMAAQLQTAQDALAEARRSKSEFLYAVGHALRSPLTSILGFAELMDGENPTPTPSQKHSLTQILSAGRDLQTLIDEILDVSMIESGQLSLHIESLAIKDVLQDCEALIQPLARHHNARVEFAWPSHPLLVAADPTRLRQLVMTLLRHSLSHSGTEGLVRVSCQQCADGRVRVLFEDSSSGQSSAWLARAEPANHFQLMLSQQLAECMGCLIASGFGTNTEGDAGLYWLEMNTAESTLCP